MLYQLDAACYSGSSGAPVLNEKGELVGVVCENVIIGRGVQIPNIAFAISYEVIKEIVRYKDDIDKIKEIVWFNIPSKEINDIFTFQPKSKY